jgi:SAM-dependent methyltransferase
MRKLLDRIVRPFGLRVVKAHQAEMVYMHAYSGGYEQYREVQVLHNKRKLKNVWADDRTLATIAEDLKAHRLGATGICHGARNGYEVEWFREHLGGEVIGTDISETATEFPHMHVWDFQDENPDWAGRFDFVYTNSLDQAMDPARALSAWAKQLAPKGRIYIEHTMAHAPQGAGEMDPFGAHPMAMPYLLFTWGRGQYALADILEVEEKLNNRHRAWVFVLERAQS